MSALAEFAEWFLVINYEHVYSQKCRGTEMKKERNIQTDIQTNYTKCKCNIQCTQSLITLHIQGGPKKRYPNFIFAITSLNVHRF